MRSIIIGRDEEDLKKFGEDGLAALGKHYVRTGDKVNLANEVLLDLARPHVVLVSGKRGQGKSYTLGVIAEEIIFLPRRLREKLTVIIFDTMGIYWTMKFPNHKDEKLLAEWGIEGRGLDVKIFTPTGFYEKYNISEWNLNEKEIKRIVDDNA